MTRQKYYMQVIVLIIVTVICQLILSKVEKVQSKKVSKKNCKRKNWFKQQAAVLVSSWKHLYKEIETIKEPSAWSKVKELVDKRSQPKSVIKIKNLIKEFESFYKQSKNNKKKNGTSLYFSAFYHDFVQVLGTRNVGNLQYVTQVGEKDAVSDPLKQSHGCYMVHTPSMQYPSNT